MDLQGLIRYFRKQVSDEDIPYLWDDEEALQFAIDAQDMFVRLVGGISDYTTPEIVDIDVVADQPMSAFSPYILRIRSVKLLTAKRPVQIISEADLTLKGSRDYGWVTASWMDDTVKGDVNYGIIGVEDHSLRWWKVPIASDTARMHVYRLPFPRIVDQDDELEIEDFHRIHLVDWMKALCYAKEDSETFDKALSARNEQSFRDYCDRAKAEKDRQRFKPRIVHYGGL